MYDIFLEFIKAPCVNGADSVLFCIVHVCPHNKMVVEYVSCVRNTYYHRYIFFFVLLCIRIVCKDFLLTGEGVELQGVLY